MLKVGDKVRVISSSYLAYYPCTIEMIDDGEYFVCCEFECRWLDETDIEVVQ